MVLRYHEQETEVVQAPTSKIFVGRIVHSKTLKHIEILPRAALGVRSDGRIAFLHELDSTTDDQKERFSTEEFQNAEIVHLKASQFLLPGLIDTHLHAPQWPNLALGMEGDLREWVENWTDPIEVSYSDNDKARRVYTDVARTTLRLGSTTVAYNSSIHSEATNILADCCYKAGQRAIIGKMCITQGSTHGNWEKSIEASLTESEKSIKYIQDLDPTRSLIHPCVQPRGGPYCPSELMQGLGAQSHRYNAYVQAHMCETHSDVERTLKLHKDFDCYSDMYKANGLLHEKSVVAHCIHLQPKDFENLKSTKAGVAHNPNSNTCLRDGECRVRELLDMDIKVGLGTDCSAGYMPSIHDAMRNASNVSRHLAVRMNDDRYVLGFSEILYLATMGGAQVVNMEGEIGNFKKGKKLDALLIDVDGIISADPSLWESETDESDAISKGEAMVKKFVFLGDDRNIRKVYVNGNLVSGHDKIDFGQGDSA